MDKYIDVEDRDEDYKLIKLETFRAELGIRSIGLIYDDHSSDPKSYENIFRLKDNIEYRLFSATHQYLIFLRELHLAENYLYKLFKENPNFIDPHSYPFGNPYFEQVEIELSSVFDSIIFHLSSVFDYFSHLISYMYFQNKENTLYWTKLSKKVRSGLKDKFEFCLTLDQIDRRFAGKLYDYRSRLLHNKRDKHKFNSTIQFNDFEVKLMISSSETSLKHFPIVNIDNQENKIITLTYLSSWLIKQTFKEIETLLDSIKIDLEKDSKFYQNLAKPKNETGFMLVNINQETKFIEPSSEVFWKQYKEKING